MELIYSINHRPLIIGTLPIGKSLVTVLIKFAVDRVVDASEFAQSMRVNHSNCLWSNRTTKSIDTDPSIEQFKSAER